MPFTFSHPAILIPLRNSRLAPSVTALIVGSMIPDFEFIVQMRTVENIGHHWSGLLLFDLPAALFLCFAFHQYVRDGLIPQLPNWYRVRLSRFTGMDWLSYTRLNLVRVQLSIVAGIGSHLFLDAFTHSDGLFVTLLPVLQDEVYLAGQRTPVYLVLQFVSSVWGLWLLHRFIARMPVVVTSVQVVSTSPDVAAYWSAITLVAVGIFLIRLLVWPEALALWDLVFAGMGSVFYALLVVSILRRIRKHATWQVQ